MPLVDKDARRVWQKAYAERTQERRRAREAANRADRAAKKAVYDVAYRIRKADKLAAYREANLERMRERDRIKWLSKRGERIKQMADWRAKNREPIAAYRLAKLEDRTAYNLAWVKANADRMRVYANNRRARKAAGGSHTPAQIRAIMRVQKGKCIYCKVDVTEKYDVDHIMPLALGGSNDRRNLQITCPSCNGSKGAKHPIDFAQQRGFLL